MVTVTSRPFTDCTVLPWAVPLGRLMISRSPALIGVSRSRVITRPSAAEMRPPFGRPATTSSATGMTKPGSTFAPSMPVLNETVRSWLLLSSAHLPRRWASLARVQPMAEISMGRSRNRRCSAMSVTGITSVS
ncbi:hypothetical protein D3C79_808420 [compost metagenome]